MTRYGVVGVDEIRMDRAWEWVREWASGGGNGEQEDASGPGFLEVVQEYIFYSAGTWGSECLGAQMRLHFEKSLDV